MTKSETYITIPLYNNKAVILDVITSLKKNGFKNIIVVDDGSIDKGFNRLTNEPGIILGRHIINRGQGATLQTATEIALEKGAKYIVHFDSDGQHDAKDLDRMLEKLIEGNYDIVLGSRFLQKNNIPTSKKIVLRLGIIFTYLLSRIWLTDVHNGLRVMTAETAKKLNIQHDRFEHASEILDKIKVLNLKYTEIPVTIHYTDYSKSKGQSIFNSVNIAFKLILSKIK